MTIIDLTIVNVSLPTIGRDLHFSATSLQWVVTAYALTFGGFMLLGGRAADLLGRRRILMVGLALFTAASLGAALSTSEVSLIAARAVQGLGAAIMLPAALSIVMNMFDEGAERNKALGIWGGLGAGGATVGLIAGGLLTRYAGWQYIFYLNVPIGTAALLLAPRIVPESRLATVRRRFDAAGALAGTGGLVLLVDAISQAPQYGWGAARTIAVLAASVALLVGVPGDREPGEGSGAAASDLPAAHAGRRERGGAAVGRQLLRVHLRRHPVHAGGAALQRAADRSRVAGRVADLDRARRPLTGAGHPWRRQGRDGDRDDADRRGRALGDPGARPRTLRRRTSLGPFVVAGAGTAFAFIPISIAALAGVEEHRAGLASGLLNTSQQLGGAIGIAIASSVAASHTQALLHAGHAAPAALTGGFQQALWVLGAIALLALPAIFALVRRDELSDAVAKTTIREPQPALVPSN